MSWSDSPKRERGPNCSVAASAPKQVETEPDCALFLPHSHAHPTALGVDFCLWRLSRKGFVVELRDTKNTHAYGARLGGCPTCRSLTPTRLDSTPFPDTWMYAIAVLVRCSTDPPPRFRPWDFGRSGVLRLSQGSRASEGISSGLGVLKLPLQKVPSLQANTQPPLCVRAITVTAAELESYWDVWITCCISMRLTPP